MLTLLTCLLIGAAPAKRELTLAAPGLNYVGVSEQQGDVYLDYFSQQVSKRGVHVVSPRDITAALGMERQKQLLGCMEGQKSCMAELAGALGVSALVVGSIATAGTGFVVNLKIMDSVTTRALAVYSERVSSEDALYAMLEKSAVELAALLAPPPPPATARTLAWVPFSAGLLSGAVGGVLFGVAKGLEGDVARGAMSITSLSDARAQLQTAVGLQTGSLVAAGVGVGALLISVGMLLFGAETPSVALQLGPDGAALGFAWRLP
jgi:hypothetical protein